MNAHGNILTVIARSMKLDKFISEKNKYPKQFYSNIALKFMPSAVYCGRFY